MQRLRHAFTLLELLVSITVLAVMVLLLAQLFREISNSWLSASSKSDRNRVGRTLMEFINRELRSATLPVQNPPPAGNPNLQFLINPPAGKVPQDYHNPHCIFWQAPVATEQSRGELAEVGYFVKWEVTGATAIPSLRRFFVNPTIYNSTSKSVSYNPDFLIYQSWDSWLTPALLAKVAPADKPSGYAGLVAENVVGLWIRSYGADGLEIANSTSGFDSRIGYNINLGGQPQTRYLPTSISLSIAQLDSRHATLLGTSWTKVRTLANDSATKDASEFLKRFQQAAETDHDFKALLPGLRIYNTNVTLENAR